MNLTAICEPIFWIMLDSQHLTTLWASAARYGDSFTFLYADDVPYFTGNTPMCLHGLLWG
jgi:hypothetical protein